MKRFSLLLLCLSILSLFTFGVAAQEPGTFVYALRIDPETLDVQNGSGSTNTIGQFLGATLITLDPETSAYVPWLASDWSVSEDGLTWTFHLRTDVKFHDGSPLTTADYAWTLNRAIDPENPTYMGSLLDGMAAAEALDDTTLQITMAFPNYSLLAGLANPSLQPLSQAWVEAQGDDYGRNPLGVGPFKFVSWSTSQNVILERNTDYTWAPAWAEGLPQIDRIEFRIIPEYATRVAALEVGEVDFSDLQPNDAASFEGSASLQIVSRLSAGTQNAIFMNLEREPFTDARVRQAFAQAINRDGFIAVVGQGHGAPAFSPLSSATTGYWDGAEAAAPPYDLDAARALLADAGWTDSDGDGILDKDGQPLIVEFKTNGDFFGTLATVFQDQMRQLGVQIDIQLLDVGVLLDAMDGGDYTLTASSLGLNDSQALFFEFHSSMIGFANTGRVADPALDAILERMSAAVSAEDNQAASNEVQQYVIENAYILSTFTPERFWGVSNRVQGVIFGRTGTLYLDQASLQ